MFSMGSLSSEHPVTHKVSASHSCLQKASPLPELKHAEVGVWVGPKELRQGVGIIGNPDIPAKRKSGKHESLAEHVTLPCAWG